MISMISYGFHFSKNITNQTLVTKAFRFQQVGILLKLLKVF